METIMINKKQTVSAKNVSELTNGVKQSLTKIDAFVAHNDYRLSGSLDVIADCDLETLISKLSLNKRKELRDHIWRVENKPSIQTINRFLHFMMKLVLKSDARIKVLKSEKQLKIEDLRKKYKDALALAKKAHAEYKEEKGDFYKNRLQKNQVIG